MADKITIPIGMSGDKEVIEAFTAIHKALENRVMETAKKLNMIGKSIRFKGPQVEYTTEGMAYNVEAKQFVPTKEKRKVRPSFDVYIPTAEEELARQQAELDRKRKEAIAKAKKRRMRAESLQTQEEMRKEYNALYEKYSDIAERQGFAELPQSKQKDIRKALPELKRTISAFKQQLSERKSLRKKRISAEERQNRDEDFYYKQLAAEQKEQDKERIKQAQLARRRNEMRREYADLYNKVDRLAREYGLPSIPRSQSTDIEVSLRELKRRIPRLQNQVEQVKRADKAAFARNYIIPYLRKEIETYSKELKQRPPTLDYTNTDVRNMRILQATRSRLRIRAQEQKRINEDKAESTRHALMSSASIGIGLFGSGAMPLLNVAFAAWSGGGKAAAIAGAATAIGEVVRAIDNLRASSLEAAREVNFLSQEYKLAEAKRRGTQAFFGGLTSVTEMIKIRNDEQFLRENMLSVVGANNIFGGMKAGYINEFKKSFARTFEDIASLKPFDIVGNFGTVANRLARNLTVENPLITGFFEGRRNAAEANSNTLKTIQDSFDMALRKANAPTVGIENDPYSIWMRIQTSALNPMKGEERQLEIETLQALKDLTDALVKKKEQELTDKLNKEITDSNKPEYLFQRWFPGLYNW